MGSEDEIFVFEFADFHLCDGFLLSRKLYFWWVGHPCPTRQAGMPVLPVTKFCSSDSIAAMKEGKMPKDCLLASFVPDFMPGAENLRWSIGGHYLVIIRNMSDAPMKISDIKLNGASVAEGLKLEVLGGHKYYNIWHGEDLSNPSEPISTLTNAGEPLWYKITPSPIPPGELGQVLVKTRSVPAHPVKVSLVDNKGIIHETVAAPEESKLRLAFVGFGPNCDRLVIFVKKLLSEPLTLDKVYLDEVDVSFEAKILGSNFWNDLCVITVRLNSPLSVGSYHLVRVTTEQGVQAFKIMFEKKGKTTSAWVDDVRLIEVSD